MSHTPVKHFRELQAMLRELDEWFENPDPAEAYHLLIDLRKAAKKATQHIPMYDAIEGARKRPELYGLDVGDLEEMSDQDIEVHVLANTEWDFTPGARKESDDDDWYAITGGGYIDPEACLKRPEQVHEVSKAVAVLESFFSALHVHERQNGHER